MTSRVLTPWGRSRLPVDGDAAGSCRATRILDWQSDPVTQLVEDVVSAGDPLDRLRRAHELIGGRVRPVYALNDEQPVSVTLRRGRGSCSQRLAVLEAVARAITVPTRVRALLVDGRFWYPRFPRLRAVVPAEVLLAWPEFRIDGQWLSVSELFGEIDQLAAGGTGFSNTGGETLFDAVRQTAVDWDGRTSAPGECSACDLSARVLADLGRFNDRDEIFRRYRQTICAPVRVLADPALSRWSPTG